MDASSGDLHVVVERVCAEDASPSVLDCVRRYAVDGRLPQLVADVLAAELGKRRGTMEEFTDQTWEAVTQTCRHFEEVADKDVMLGCKCLMCLLMLLDGGATNDADTLDGIMLWLDAHSGAKELIDFAYSIPAPGGDRGRIVWMLEALTRSG